jgi:hypothetical protein
MSIVLSLSEVLKFLVNIPAAFDPQFSTLDLSLGPSSIRYRTSNNNNENTSASFTQQHSIGLKDAINKSLPQLSDTEALTTATKRKSASQLLIALPFQTTPPIPPATPQSWLHINKLIMTVYTV